MKNPFKVIRKIVSLLMVIIAISMLLNLGQNNHIQHYMLMALCLLMFYVILREKSQENRKFSKETVLPAIQELGGKATASKICQKVEEKTGSTMYLAELYKHLKYLQKENLVKQIFDYSEYQRDRKRNHWQVI